MNARIATLLLVALLSGGCLASSFDPSPQVISGTVFDRFGHTINHAKVWIPGVASTYTDSGGRYHLFVPRSVNTFIRAANGFTPGQAIVEQCGGSTPIGPARTRGSKDIVLTDCTPI